MMCDIQDGVLYSPKPRSRYSSAGSARKSVNDHKLSRAWVLHNIKKKEISCGDECEYPTDAFGEVDFKGTTRKAKAKFIRLSNTTDPESIFTLMTKYWNMAKPRLLISVTGGAKELCLDSRLKRVFQSGLLKVAQTPGAWVITGGTNSGVMQLVGEALQGATDNCIGISTWGIIQNRESLRSADGDGRLGGKFPYQVGCSLNKAYLDPNHTHHLMVDDGQSGKYGADIAFRSQFQKYSMEYEGAKVPSVLLVVEGGIGTIDTIWSTISDSLVPVVIVKGSGRACDIIAHVLASTVESDKDNMKTDEVLTEMIHEAFLNLQDEMIASVCEKLKFFVKMKEYFTVFDFGRGVDFDECLLMALLRAHGSDHIHQLHLTLVWNRADLARENILSRSRELRAEDLQKTMILALALDRVDFVKLFLEYGVNIGSFITNDLLEFLYGFASQTKTSILSYQFDQSKVNLVCANLHCLEDTQGMIRLLCRYEFDSLPVAIPRRVIGDVINVLCRKLMNPDTSSIIEDFQTSSIENGLEKLVVKSQVFIYPYRELFFWAVLNNKHEMALYLWEFEQEKITKALIAAEINQVLSKRSQRFDLSEDLVKSFSTNAREFKTLALNVLSECYETDESKTMQLIQTELSQFPNMTCLDVAVQSEDMDFVSHSAVQILLDEVWTGDVVYRNVTEWQLIGALLFPPLIHQLEFHPPDDNGFQDDTASIAEELYHKDSINQDEHLKVNGSIGKVDLNDEDCLEESRELFHDDIPSYRSASLPYFKKFYGFYFSTPLTSFYASVISYMIFLMVYAYFCLLKKDNTVHPEEMFLVMYVVSLMTAEIHQFSQGRGNTLRAKLTDWSSSKWNILDAAAIILFFIAFGLRLHADTIQIGHLLYSINGGFWVLRSLKVFYVDPTLGPYVVMLCRMMRDLKSFLVILLIFLISYGVASKSVLDPQARGSSAFQLLKNIVFHPYFNIYGELFIDRDPANNETTRFGTPIVHTYAEPVAWFLLGMYLLVTNILLMNILIAIFNNTFNDVQEKSDKIWKFERVGLVTEYALRAPLAPPLNLLAHVFYFLRWIFRRCSAGAIKDAATVLRSSVADEVKEELIEFENKCVTSFIRKKSSESDGDLSSYSMSSVKHLEFLANDLTEKMNALKSELKFSLDALREHSKVIKE